MKTVLITGSNGLLGQKLVATFMKSPGWRVVATSFSPDKIGGKGYEFELLDISSKVEIDYIFNRYQPSLVINTAAMTQVDTCEEHKEDCWKVNVEAVENMIAACNKENARFMHLSSDFVFNGRDGKYTEADPASPVNYYGISKLEGEKKVMSQARYWNIVRTSLVYGVNPDTARPNILLWLRYALGEKQNVKVNNDQFRTPTLAEDLAEGCRLLADSDKQGIYHLAGGEYVSVLQVAQAVAEVFELDTLLIEPVPSSELKEQGKRPLRGGLDISKAWDELGYRPHPLLEGIRLVKSQLEEPRFSLDI
jgi:dTDP-4-dehydrorhamnose reductase